ncbi:Activating signal cointegrator 1 complex subunit 3 [Dufourea novaeangliae]|uniref:Activating signal cointegrator 1 complex subunit 3 n=1 Tax=Dufourea novaeangliae TaxID=178035 RepID=A0A154P7Z0_DUFNO|nr:Activating signal cointegrator 1 complex subunit 3 [Dufourea novaeangliae]
MLELPRITRSVRLYTNLGRIKSTADLEPNDLLKKQAEQSKLKSELNWHGLVSCFPKDVKRYLDELRRICAKIFDDCPVELVHEFTIFTLYLLIDEECMTQKVFNMLKERAGNLEHQDAGNIMKIILLIRKNLSEDMLTLLRNNKENINNKETSENKVFDAKFVYKPARAIWPNTIALRSMSSESISERTNNFTMNYNDYISKSCKTEFNKARCKEGLKLCHMKYLEMMSFDVFVKYIMDVLKTSGNQQNDLLDFLGCEQIDFIQYIIQHKNSITALATGPCPGIKIPKVSHGQGPVISGQVTVQSEKEKYLRKQIRKEEKKLNKMSGKREGNDIESQELYLKKQEALIESRTPIFKKDTYSSKNVRENFPFVFDSNTNSRCTNGYVSGQKIMLPENVAREDTNTKEEVRIPIPELQEINVSYKPIKISTLDDIGQMAFSGIEELNRIQSIVFDVAYHTNENLLICAPTGAGKTNVAMLTVIHQIKQHIEQGQLMKNQFKIIYVTPMKALAAEMTTNFGKRLERLGISVRELTGDMQLTKSEIQQTQMIVTTPEKWDVLTRKGAGDTSLTRIVKLLIIDEVHLLHGDRGPVVEALVARTIRQVESSQSMIRIVGLSATLPNYVDVAKFLRVNPYRGLFYFDHRFRPVPLSQTFIGVKATAPLQQATDMDLICYEKVVEFVRNGHQVLVFVHARNATIRVATVLKELAMKHNTLKLFIPDGHAKFTRTAFAKSNNKHLLELFNHGLSVHHAGLLRAERNQIEKFFSDGLIRVLVCTSTLAWGVNLPAHAVIIRGTEIYDSQRGSYIDLDILDVLQIFGRAGRPQFDTEGHATIITAHSKLYHYLSLLTNQIPIESNFIKYLADNLNAEIALGTISNVEEAIQWLSYTYLFVRMRLNHHVYGIPYQVTVDDPNLEQMRRELIDISARSLDQAKMIRYNQNTGDLNTTDLGRIASHFYLKYDTVQIFNELIKAIMTEADVLAMISQSQEFKQLKVRDDEINELQSMFDDCCELEAKGGVENIYGKVNILLQTYLSRARINTFSLISDQAYVTQNAVRICRALFTIMLRQNNAIMSGRLLEIAKMLELQQWSHKTPLRQFFCLPLEIINKIEDYELRIERLYDMNVKEIGDILRNPRAAVLVKKCCEELPMIEMEYSLQPITRRILRIRLKIYPQFQWNDKVHGKTSEPFWIWIEDPDTNFLYHHEYFVLTKKMVCNQLEQELVMTIPLQEPLPSQYIVKATSDRWLGSESMTPLTFHDLILPDIYPPFTDLLDLQLLPVKALAHPVFERLYKFTHFNLIQTQIFHCLYHTDNNVLLGAPTVRERIKDWKIRLEEQLGKKVVELTGDVTPDVKVIASANVIVTTPEKWDGISRSWQTRSYVKDVALIIIDEIHLLGEDRGPVLEVIISRTNFISSHTKKKLRIIGLSTALANAVDLANWLGIQNMGLYNFRPSVRPVPLEIHINGFPGKHYCPRMATMNRPTFQAIRQHSPCSPALVFVSSRRQTRLTALDLIAYLAAEDNPKQWLHMPDEEMNNILDHVRDSNLKLTLAFGIGLHHAGLHDKDKRTVEELFVNNKIQVLITTATLAWGVNFPAHLVVIKGTEYYDGKTKRYVDMPITDVLQMMGRAGRPQFDNSGVAVVLVHDLKKNFYKNFLHEPFPVESSLLAVLPDHINAEIVAGTIKNKQEFLDYLTWTYFFRRLMKNPKYYDLHALEPHTINEYLSSLVDNTIQVLMESHCIDFDESEQIIYPLSMGKIASFYYLTYKTMLMFEQSLKDGLSLDDCLRILCNSNEYNELPVRHNEELLNEELSKMCRYRVDNYSYDSPNTKAFLLLQAHFSRLPLPCTDYTTDLKLVLDQAIRILQAMIDTVAEHGWLSTTLVIIQLLQMIIQARWIDESAITTLPHISSEHLPLFSRLTTGLPALCNVVFNRYHSFVQVLGKHFQENEIYEIHQVIKAMPAIYLDLSLNGHWSDSTAQKPIMLSSENWIYIDVHKDHDYVLNIGLRRKNKSNNLKAHCPMYEKGKDEGWFLILGNIYERDLLALKRVSGINDQWRHHQLEFTAPSRLGEVYS